MVNVRSSLFLVVSLLSVLACSINNIHTYTFRLIGWARDEERIYMKGAHRPAVAISSDDLLCFRGEGVVRVAFRTAARDVEELALVGRQLPVVLPPFRHVGL